MNPQVGTACLGARYLDDVRGEERGIEVSCHILLRVFARLTSRGTRDAWDALSLRGLELATSTATATAATTYGLSGFDYCIY